MTFVELHIQFHLNLSFHPDGDSCLFKLEMMTMPLISLLEPVSQDSLQYHQSQWPPNFFIAKDNHSRSTNGTLTTPDSPSSSSKSIFHDEADVQLQRKFTQEKVGSAILLDCCVVLIPAGNRSSPLRWTISPASPAKTSEANSSPPSTSGSKSQSKSWTSLSE